LGRGGGEVSRGKKKKKGEESYEGRWGEERGVVNSPVKTILDGIYGRKKSEASETSERQTPSSRGRGI